MLINGKWLETGPRAEIRSPYDGRTAGSILLATKEQVLEAAKYAREYRPELSAWERAGVLLRTAEELERDRASYISSITAESGMCVKDAGNEVARAAALLRVCAEEAKRITGESLFTDNFPGAGRDLAVTLREPVGLVCAITPFNRPLNQVAVKLGPALAANNSVLLKPSEKTPLTAIKFVKALINNGLPARMVSLITGHPGEIGDALASCPYLDMITFTGSRETGERIARNAGMIKTVFELGDSGALIVLEDADLDKAVQAACAGAYGNAGQSCRGVKRILVQERVASAFAEKLTAETEKLAVGDPRSESTDIGTLINEEAARLVEQRINDAVKAGARLLCGGKRSGAQLFPSVLTGVPRDSDLVAKETFGPCAPIMTVKDIGDAISCANSTEYGLQTGIFTNDLQKALYAAQKLKVGAVLINKGPQYDSPHIPFGGVKKSGFGREGVRYAINEMTTLKTVVF